MSKKIYCINEMRPALVNAYEDGNLKCINAKQIDELGIEKGYFDSYVKTVENLYLALNEYVHTKHTPDAKAEDISAKYEMIFPLWKILLECGEKEKNAKDFKVDLRDIEDLVGFCQKFANNSNAEKARKVWASETKSAFRRKIETMLGIKIAKADVLTDEMRDWLRQEKSKLNSIKKTETAIEDNKSNILALKERIKKANSKQIEAFFKADIENMERENRELKTKLETQNAELEEVRRSKPAK